MLKLESVSVAFPAAGGGIQPVDGVSLEVGETERHMIVGETGSGKSVLLTSILGLVEGRVTGRIVWNGRELTGLSEKEYSKIRGREIAYIPQSGGGSLNPLMKIGRQIGEPLEVHRGASRKEAFAAAVEALRQLDFQRPEYWARQYPHRLSGGMRQRVLVAMGTIAGGGLVLADEPTKGLDAERREEVARLFRRLSGTALLCVTHDLEFARTVGERISVLYAGQILESGPKEAFFQAPLHPYSQMMIRSLPEHGFQSVKGFAPSHQEYGGMGCRFAERCPKAGEKCRKPPPRLQMGERQVLCWYADGGP